MKCPVCSSNEHEDLDLQAEGFTEGIMECRICGSLWSVTHGAVSVIKDAQEHSFLGEVPAFYYSYAA